MTPNERVAVGREGWLFVTTNRALEVVRGMAPMSHGELSLWLDALESREQWAEQRGMQHLVVFVPAKGTIYPEHLPRGLTKLGPTRLEQVSARLGERGVRAEWLDLTDAMRVAMTGPFAGELLYRQHDSHWNVRGAFVGYHAILERLARRRPELSPRPKQAFRFQEVGEAGGGFGERLYLSDLVKEPNIVCRPSFRLSHRKVATPAPETQVLVTRVDDESLPTAVVFHDSFGELLRPLLAEHFRRAEFHRIIDFDVGILERVRPDVVVTVLAEPNLVNSRPYAIPSDTPEKVAAEFAEADDVLLRLDGEGGLGRTVDVDATCRDALFLTVEAAAMGQSVIAIKHEDGCDPTRVRRIIPPLESS